MSADLSHPGSASAPHLPGELPKQYRPADHEPRIRERWEGSGAFHPDPERVLRGEAKPYGIFIPPPNVTDRLHLGHALNNSLQDILVRAHRMMGFETLWMPGTDHAGIATQAVVEKRLRKEGKLKGALRESMKREDFVATVQSFKDEYEATITGQLKAMGCSCDWQRQRFTMDEQCAKAVYEAFFRLFKDGLIYRGKRLVNWDPVLQTAVADDECYEEEIDAEFFYLRYPLVHPHGSTTIRERRRHRPAPSDAVPVTWSELRARGWPRVEDAQHADDMPAWITVATTRPETYLGDTAVAVNPRDPRAKALRGLFVELPLIGRVVPILEDDYVVLPAVLQEDPEEAAKDPKARYATGFLKVTPAHDPNDYDIGQRHKPEIEAAGNAVCINIFAPDATISDKHGWSAAREVAGAHMLVGLKRDDARKKVVAEFKAHTVSGDPAAPHLFDRSVPYRHSVKHSDRSKAIIEPYLSDQWYVKVTDDRLRGSALRAMATEQRSDASASYSASSSAPSPGFGGTGVPPVLDEARAAGDGDLRFQPGRYAKTFETWHENIRDWCISRQLWWGHQIPVWSRACATREEALGTREALRDFLAKQQWKEGEDFFVRAINLDKGEDVPWPSSNDEFNQWQQETLEPLEVFMCCSKPPPWHDPTMIRLAPPPSLRQQLSWSWELTRDPDVLDTWFSSGLWPMSTLGWPENTDLLNAFNPSSVLCTAREIITLWVSRMVMFNRYFMTDGAPGEGRLPFRDVFIHALIMDGSGQKMSKSLGNGVDPLDIIASHGSDAMRFVLCQMTTQTQDVRMPVVKDSATGRNTSPKFDLGRNFCNKLWNAARFALTFLSDDATKARGDEAKNARSLADRWLLSRLAAATDAINASLRDYQFSEYAQAIYDLLWRDFCDWYLEAIKPTVAQDRAQQAVLAHALESIVRLLHPIAPFVTEAIWERLKDVRTDAVPGITLGPSRKGGLLCTAGWPEVSPSLRDEAAEREFERVRTLVTAIREVRAQHNVPPKRRIALHLPAAIESAMRGHTLLVSTLAGLSRIDAASAPPSSVLFTIEGDQAALSDLADAVDAAAERARLEKVVADATRTIATLEARLANPGYAQKAPPAMVQQTRDQLTKAKAEQAAATESLARLPA